MQIEKRDAKHVKEELAHLPLLNMFRLPYT